MKNINIIEVYESNQYGYYVALSVELKNQTVIADGFIGAPLYQRSTVDASGGMRSAFVAWEANEYNPNGPHIDRDTIEKACEQIENNAVNIWNHLESNQ
jgi:hypothetical protein